MSKDQKHPPAINDDARCTICLQTGHRASKCPERLGKITTGRKSAGKKWQ